MISHEVLTNTSLLFSFLLLATVLIRSKMTTIGYLLTTGTFILINAILCGVDAWTYPQYAFSDYVLQFLGAYVLFRFAYIERQKR